MKSAIWWLPAGAFLIAGILIVVMRKGPQETADATRTGAPSIRQGGPVVTQRPATAVGGADLNSPDTVPPPHEVSPAPPLGFVPAPDGSFEAANGSSSGEEHSGPE